MRVVNFGDVSNQSHYTPISRAAESVPDQSGQSNQATQPWNYKFDLNQAQLESEPFEMAPIDNYAKFYLTIFMRRLWPLISQVCYEIKVFLSALTRSMQKVTPFLMTAHPGRLHWTVAELVQVLGQLSGTHSNAFTQNPFTLRRKKSWVPDHIISRPESGKFWLIRPHELYQIILKTENDDIPGLELVELSESISSQATIADTGYVDTETDTDALSQDETATLTSEHLEDEEFEEGELVEQLDPEELQRTADAKNRKEWEDGRIDWMGQYGSDKIMNRLKNIIRK